MVKSRKVYPTDVGDAEWEFVAPYLTLLREDAAQRVHAPARRVRCVALDGQSRLSVAAPAGRLSALAGRATAGRTLDQWRAASRRWSTTCVNWCACWLSATQDPARAIYDGRTLQSSPESGARAGYDGYKRKKGSKVHIAVDTLGSSARAGGHARQ